MFFTILTAFSILIYFLIYNFRNQISEKLSIIDKPNEARKIHKFPTPKTGSFSIAVIIIILMLTNYFNNFFDKDVIIILFGSILIFLVGFLDDRYRLSAIAKIISISLITLLVCLLSENLIIHKFYIYTLDTFFSLEIFSIFFTILCVLCLVNALNLADGINGLALGIIITWLFYINQIYENNLDLLINIIFLNLFLILINNLRGKYFLGDSGSLMLSSFVALLIIYLHNQNIDLPNHRNSSESILIIFLIPVLDMIRLFFQRLSKRKNPGIGDSNHLHHFLINKLPLYKTLIIYFTIINIPILISLSTRVSKPLIILGTILIYFFLIIYYKPHAKTSYKR